MFKDILKGEKGVKIEGAPSLRAWTDREQLSFVLEGIFKGIISSLGRGKSLKIRLGEFETDEGEERFFGHLGLPAKRGILIEIIWPATRDDLDLEFLLAQRVMARLGIMEVQRGRVMIKLSAVRGDG